MLLGICVEANACCCRSYRYVGKYRVPCHECRCDDCHGEYYAGVAAGTVVGVAAMRLGTQEGDRWYYHQPAFKVTAPTRVVEVVPNATCPNTVVVQTPVAPAIVSMPAVNVTKSFENTVVVNNQPPPPPPEKKDSFLGVQIFGFKIGVDL